MTLTYCNDCWIQDKKHLSWKDNPCPAKGKRYGLGHCCTEGVNTADIITAIDEKISKKNRTIEIDKQAIEKEYQKPRKNWYLLAVRFKILHKALKERHALIDQQERLKIAEWTIPGSTRIKRNPYAKDFKLMDIFCCKNCLKPVSIPHDTAGVKVRFKCPDCHLENLYDLS